MDDILVSMLLPCRGRHEGTRQSLASLLLASDPSRIEVLVRADDDDPLTAQIMQEQWPFQVKTIVGPRGNGYADLHLMYNELAAQARGRFLFLWNNDAVITTQDWDSMLEPFDDGKLRYFHVKVTPDDQVLSFPIVHRSYQDCLGRYSAWAHNDSYVHAVLQPFFDQGVYQDVGITVHHYINEYLEAKDAPSIEGRAQWSVTRPVRRTSEYQRELASDRAKVAAWLASHR